jgi:hypothetical protein
MSPLAASWLTSGWVDLAIIAGWVALVIVIGVPVWLLGPRERPPRKPRPPGRGVRLVGGLLAFLAIAPHVLRGMRRE